MPATLSPSLAVPLLLQIVSVDADTIVPVCPQSAITVSPSLAVPLLLHNVSVDAEIIVPEIFGPCTRHDPIVVSPSLAIPGIVKQMLC